MSIALMALRRDVVVAADWSPLLDPFFLLFVLGLGVTIAVMLRLLLRADDGKPMDGQGDE